MNYGLYLSASGALAGMHRQDVMANNLANINTVGFKPSDVTLAAREPERLAPGPVSMFAEASGLPTDSQLMLEQLGGGLFVAPSRVDLRQGPLQRTGNDLDLAIEGRGFFVVDAGRNQSQALRYTRDGRFTLNAAGELVMTATGHRVLDGEDRPITLERAQPASIDGRGNIVQGGAVVASIQVVDVRDTAALAKDGDNLLRLKSPRDTTRQRMPAAGVLHQQHVETSAVDPVMALNALINASKAVQANITMMQYHDNILGQVINTYGRVA
jgi:flagellar basal-body rod protein FlgF